MDTKKAEILVQLAQGAKPRKLSDDFDVPYSTIMTWRREMGDSKVKDEVLDVAKADKVVLATVVEGIKEQATDNLPPATAKSMGRKLDQLEEGISSLQLLDTQFHDTIIKLLKWADKQITDDMSMRDWKMLASSIGDLHSAIFSKGGTNINLMQQNNSGSSARVERFKGSFRT